MDEDEENENFVDFEGEDFGITDDVVRESIALPMTNHMHGALLSIDKFVPNLAAGKLPFSIKMEMDGRLLKAGRAKSFDDQSIWTIYYAKQTDGGFQQIKSKAVYAVYWAESVEKAIELASEEVRKLKASGAFNIELN